MIQFVSKSGILAGKLRRVGQGIHPTLNDCYMREL